MTIKELGSMKHLRMKPHNSTRLLLMALILFVLPQTINGAPPDNPKPIDKEEFMRLFKKGTIINERRIPARIIAEAIKWSQDAEARQEKIPSRLEITNSIIGSHDGMLVSDYLRITPVKDLPLALRQPYEAPDDISSAFDFFGVEKSEGVAVIPIEIWITNSLIYNGMSFPHTIFQKPVNFSGSIINHLARFSRTTFQDYINFDRAKLDDANFAQVNFQAIAIFNKTIFPNNVNFSGAKFHESAWFEETRFGNDFKGPSEESEIEPHTRMAFVDFDKRVSFVGAIFLGETQFFFATFLGEAAFNQAIIQGKISFISCLFTKDSYFSQIKGDSSTDTKGNRLNFSGTSFKGRVYFDNVEVRMLSFTRLLEESSETRTLSLGKWGEETETKNRLLMPPVSIDGRADFTNLRCASADFSDVEFRSYADFSKTKFTNYVTFNNATFEDNLNLNATEFPLYVRSSQNQKSVPSGLILDGVRFQKTVNLEWNQIARSLNTQRQETWRLLEDAFKQSDNLEGQNEAMYQRRLREGAEARSLYQKAINIFERGYWGYGVRPWRLIGWMLLILAIFACIYWTQTKAMAEGKSKQQGRRDRLQYVLAFSLHTSRSLTYGYQNSRSILFKALTLFQAIGFIVMALCLLQVLANVSPLLNKLVGKLLPI